MTTNPLIFHTTMLGSVRCPGHPPEYHFHMPVMVDDDGNPYALSCDSGGQYTGCTLGTKKFRVTYPQVILTEIEENEDD